MLAYIYMHEYVCRYKCVHIDMCVYVNACEQLHIYIWVDMSVYIYI